MDLTVFHQASSRTRMQHFRKAMQAFRCGMVVLARRVLRLAVILHTGVTALPAEGD